jgi:NitT/TauT family transport system ATP-binding protein
VLTPRPGRIEEIVPIDLGDRDVDDVRSTPEFAEHRHRVWSLLHKEVRV